MDCLILWTGILCNSIPKSEREKGTHPVIVRQTQLGQEVTGNTFPFTGGGPPGSPEVTDRPHRGWAVFAERPFVVPLPPGL